MAAAPARQGCLQLLDPRQIDLGTPAVHEMQSHGKWHGRAAIRDSNLDKAQRKR
jgi:hypothetical protein